MPDLEISVASYDPTVCGRDCHRTSPNHDYCFAFKKYLRHYLRQKYKGSVNFKRCAECLAYQPVDAVDVAP